MPSPHNEINVTIVSLVIREQAEVGDDYEALSHILRVFPSDFTPDGTEFTARKEVTLVIVDDALDEPDETLNVVLQRAPSTAEVVVLRQPDGTACSVSCAVTVTIVDNDDAVPTAAKLSALVVNDGSMDLTLTPTFASDTYAYDASVGSTVAEVTVTPTPNDSGATIEYLDASDNALADADTSVMGQQVELVEGDNVINVKVTTADSTANQTYTVTVDRASATPTICTLNTGDIWCGVVTVGAITWSIGGSSTIGGYGFDSGGGDLSDKEFSYGTNSYTIDNVRLTGNGTSLSFSLTADLTDDARANLVLHVGSASFAFSDAIYLGDHTYEFLDTGLDWSSEDYVTLRLRETPTNFTATVGDTQVALAWKPAGVGFGGDGPRVPVQDGRGLSPDLDGDCGQRARGRERGRVHGDRAHQRGGPHLRAPRGERLGRRRRGDGGAGDADARHLRPHAEDPGCDPGRALGRG